VAARLRACGQSGGYQIVLQLHLGGQGEHVSAFLPGDRERVLGERAGDFLQRQAVLADLDEAWSSWACTLPMRSSRAISRPYSRPARSS
jgi:hypothetical protein